MNPNDKPDPKLIAKIRLLDDLPERDPQRASQGRAAFLAAAREMASAPAPRPGVSPAPERRHKGWMHAIQSLFVTHRKEQSPMFSALTTLLIIVTLALGGSGAAVAAAQSSQPNDLLYGLKLSSEDLRMDLESDPADAYQLALAFAERRAFEIQAMLQSGGVPPEPVQARYQAQVEQAIQLALNQPDDQAVQALEQIKLRLQAQEQVMQQIHAGGTPDVEAALVRTRAMLQERLQWVEAGLVDPVQLRLMLRQRDSSGAGTPATGAPGAGGAGPGNPWTDGTPTPGSGYGPGPGTAECSDCTPVFDGHNSQNPWTTGTPVPGSGYGPGPGEGECADCTPVYDGHNSQNPWTTGVPTPGSGYGPGPGDGECDDCTPGAGPGPQPTPVPPQPTQHQQPTQAGPQPTQYQQPTQAGPQPTQYQQPTQAGPQPTQNQQPTQAGPQPTQGGGGGGGGGGNKP